MKMIINQLLSPVLFAIYVFGAFGLFEEWLFFGVRASDEILKTPLWLSAAVYVVAVGLAVVGVRLGRAALLCMSLLGFIVFLFSLRSISLNAGTAEVTEYFAGMEVRLVELPDINDYPHCVSVSNLLLEIGTGKGEFPFISMRGFWSGRAIDHALLPLKRCPRVSGGG